MFDKLDEILAAGTSNVFELAKIAGMDETERRSLLKGEALNNLDLRNADLSDADLAGSTFEGVLANAYTKVNLSPDDAARFFAAATRSHVARAVQENRLSLYHVDEIVKLETQKNSPSTPWLRDLFYTVFDRVLVDDLDSLPLKLDREKTDNFVVGFTRSQLQKEVRLSREPALEFENEPQQLIQLADVITSSSGMYLFKDFDVSVLRGDLIRYLNNIHKGHNPQENRARAVYNRYRIVLPTIPALCVQLHVEFLFRRIESLKVNAIYHTIYPARYERTPKNYNLRISRSDDSNFLMTVPSHMRRLENKDHAVGEYSYERMRKSPLSDE